MVARQANAFLEQSRTQLAEELAEANTIILTLKSDLETATQSKQPSQRTPADLVLIGNLQEEGRMLRDTFRDKTLVLQGQLETSVRKHTVALTALEQRDIKYKEVLRKTCPCGRPFWAEDDWVPDSQVGPPPPLS